MSNPNGRTDSIESYDAQSLRRIVATVRQLLDPAIRLAGDPDDPHSTGAMQSAGVDRLDIPFVLALQRAMSELGRWGRGCETAWSRRLIREGSAPAAKPQGKSTVKSAVKTAAKAKKR